MGLAIPRQVQDYEQLYSDWLANEPADGFPIVPPTPSRVDGALAALGLPAQASIGTVAGTTIVAQDLALHAVAAGCRAEYMPLLLAAVRAFLADGERRAALFQDSTQAIIVNGPVRGALGINCKDGLLGPGWRANATIGRALHLLLAAALGAPRPSVFGDPGQLTLCFGEDEEGTSWTPLCAEAGIAVGRSAVTLHSTPVFKQMMFRGFPANGREVARYLALFLRGRASGTDWFGSSPLSILLVIGQELRRYLEAEWPDKRAFREVIVALARDSSLPGHDVNVASVDDLSVVSAGGVAYPTAWALVSPEVKPATVIVETNS